MNAWIRVAIVLPVFWVVGCGVVLLVELSRLPQPRECAVDRPTFVAFFHSTKIPAVHVRHPQLGIVAFPSTMTRPEIEAALRRDPPKFYEPTNAPIEWDVSVAKPADYYSIELDGSRFLRIAIFPAVAIFASVLAVGCGTRWIVGGSKT